jgi:succinylarginine dihydrolase
LYFERMNSSFAVSPEIAALFAEPREVNFDGLVGPTHHYAGQSFGNQASMNHAGKKSSPKRAALQGLMKAAAVRDLGLPQAIIPPIKRPKLEVLYTLGFRGSDAEMVEKAYKRDPKIISALYSASSMWVANSGTFSPAMDTDDGCHHFTAANLSSKFHRSLEARSTENLFRQIFSGPSFRHHAPLPDYFSDEGAANHGRLTDRAGDRGLELFVYGASRFRDLNRMPSRFPARQMVEASEAIARHHRLMEEGALFIQQSSEAIDAGVFHNDVISVVNENVIFLHEKAFENQAEIKEIIQKKWRGKKPLYFIEVPESQCNLKECVRSYLFNSQLVTLPSGKMKLIVPEDCVESLETKSTLDALVGVHSNVLDGYTAFPLKESMQNGGGPACLRLRVTLRKEDLAFVHGGVWLTPERELNLKKLIDREYRDELTLSDLADPQFYGETQRIFDALEDFFQLRLS